MNECPLWKTAGAFGDVEPVPFVFGLSVVLFLRQFKFNTSAREASRGDFTRLDGFTSIWPAIDMNLVVSAPAAASGKIFTPVPSQC